MKRFITGTVAGAFLVTLQAVAAEAEAAQSLNTFGDILEAGGVPMKVILGLSILGTFLVIFFLLTLRANALYPKAFLREAQDAAEDGDIEVLSAICQENDSPAARIVGAAAEQVVGAPQVDYMVIRDAIEDEGARQAGILWQRIQYLMDIAVVAPMVGLLGTVLGMLQSFSNLQSELGVVRPEALAQGVAKALITTAGGLIVGIAAMILYALFRGRVNKLVSGLEGACSRILRRFVSGRGSTRY